MPETALERYNTRQAERDALAEEFIREAKQRALAFGKSPVCADGRHDDCIGVTPHRDFAGCLCTCHDPAITYWVWWSEFDGQFYPVGMTSGPYGTAGEAIDDGFAGSGNDGPWIHQQVQRGNDSIEQITEERWDALGDWDLKTDAEKAALRPAGSEGTNA